MYNIVISVFWRFFSFRNSEKDSEVRHSKYSKQLNREFWEKFTHFTTSLGDGNIYDYRGRVRKNKKRYRYNIGGCRALYLEWKARTGSMID
ncbi:hypothetical protein Y032_0312g2178 [Ancylostoma ceylanicum]|uniref:Uncharacterized protein n=1 Tax=Ancylostoma ceylanicum TaxID=53326 RepID=A0A016S2W9_9BILA|nr:hypothetical protein Y032_0312g2178 [Ancylostoma ceylanicum]